MSKYFDESEMQCHCGCGYNACTDTLMNGLDRLREAIGRPLYASNMSRCPQHNAAVGGVSNSQHVQGTAADLLVPDGMEFGEFLWYVNEYSGADGIGEYPGSGFIHVDYRDDGASPGEYRWEG